MMSSCPGLSGASTSGRRIMPLRIVALSLVVITVALATVTAAEEKPADAWLPDAKLIAHIESKLWMPPGAGPLFAYDRYYTASESNEHRIVEGFFVRSGARRGAVYIVEKLPIVDDGGCDYVGVEFDVDSDAVTEISCNGEA